MIVEQFNANQIVPSTEVGLHAQLVSFTMSEGDGANVGFNNVQTAPPGGKAEYVWYAGSIDTDPETGFRTPTPVEFGAINLMASDPIKGSNKGLIGGLVVEPQGSTWQCDAGFAEQRPAQAGRLLRRRQAGPAHHSGCGDRQRRRR